VRTNYEVTISINIESYGIKPRKLLNDVTMFLYGCLEIGNNFHDESYMVTSAKIRMGNP